MLLVGLALAALIGLSLGLLGGGGSILTVPVFVYVLGYPAKTAIAMSLPVVGITSLSSAILHWRLGNVRPATALMFGPAAMVGAYGGAKLAFLLSGATQLAILAIVMLAAAASMLRPRRDVQGTNVTTTPRQIALLLLVALLVGTLTGLVGIGGGFLVVPALVLLAHVPMRQAVGTSLLVISMNSAAGFTGYLGTVDIDWRFLAEFSLVAIAGALLGAMLVARVPQSALRRAFAIFLFAISGFILYKNRGVFSGSHSAAVAPAVREQPRVSPTVAGAFTR